MSVVPQAETGGAALPSLPENLKQLAFRHMPRVFVLGALRIAAWVLVALFLNMGAVLWLWSDFAHLNMQQSTGLWAGMIARNTLALFLLLLPGLYVALAYRLSLLLALETLWDGLQQSLGLWLAGRIMFFAEKIRQKQLALPRLGIQGAALAAYVVQDAPWLVRQLAARMLAKKPWLERAVNLARTGSAPEAMVQLLLREIQGKAKVPRPRPFFLWALLGVNLGLIVGLKWLF